MRAYEEYKKIDLPWLEEIPAHWKVQRAKNLFKVINERSEEGKEELLSVSSNHGVVKRNDANVTMFQAESYEGYKLCWPEDLVINSLWAWQNGLGFSNFYGIVSTAYSVYRLNTPSNNYRFFDYLLRSSAFHWELRTRSKGIWKSRYILSDEDFLSSPIICPPREEQDAIVRFLDAKCAKIDSLIKLKERQIELLNEKKQNVINQAVTKGLDPHAPMKDSSVDWIGEIPKEIVISRVGLHYEVILGKMLCPSRQAENFSLEPYYCAANVHFEGISSENLKKMWFSPEEKIKYTVQQNDLLIVEGGAGAGGCAIVTSETPKACIQNSIMIVRNPDRETRYLGYLIESLVRRGYIDFVCQKATIPHFTKEKLCAVPYPVFSKEERCRIADYLDKITTSYQRKTALVQKEISILQEYKTRIISDVVTGKIAVANS